MVVYIPANGEWRVHVNLVNTVDNRYALHEGEWIQGWESGLFIGDECPPPTNSDSRTTITTLICC